MRIRTFAASASAIPMLGVNGPISVIGEFQGDGPAVFGSVGGVTLDEDRVLVTDTQARQLRAFDMSGGHLWSLGHEGDGPGELRSVALVEATGDSLLVWDARSQRISLFSVENGFVEATRIRSESRVQSPVRIGDLWITERVSAAGVPDDTDGYVSVRDTVLVESFSADGSPVSTLPGSESVRVIQKLGDGIFRRRETTLPFSRGAFLIAHGEALVGGVNDAFEVRRWDVRGHLVEIWRYPGLDRPLTENDIEALRSGIRAAYEEYPDRMREALDVVDAVDIPTLMPAFTKIISEPSGRLWLRRSSEEAENWIVIDGGSGLVYGLVELPQGFRLSSVRDGVAAGTWADELDVDYIHLYSVEGAGAN